MIFVGEKYVYDGNEDSLEWEETKGQMLLCEWPNIFLWPLTQK
jgi:hypothetical protein